jgi:hypothetical protein
MSVKLTKFSKSLIETTLNFRIHRKKRRQNTVGSICCEITPVAPIPPPLSGKISNIMKLLLAKVWPFIALGITIVIFVAGIVILSYVLIFGALIGLILFAIQWLRNSLFAKKTPPPEKVEHKGRIIDHDDV